MVLRAASRGAFSVMSTAAAARKLGLVAGVVAFGAASGGAFPAAWLAKEGVRSASMNMCIAAVGCCTRCALALGGGAFLLRSTRETRTRRNAWQRSCSPLSLQCCAPAIVLRSLFSWIHPEKN